jgi:hypothetical protein
MACASGKKLSSGYRRYQPDARYVPRILVLSRPLGNRDRAIQSRVVESSFSRS